MKRFLPFATLPLVLIVVGWIVIRENRYSSGSIPDQVTYRGESIRVLSAHPDDPEAEFSIDPSEIARAQRLVREATTATEYPGRRELIGGISDLQFPGYGMMQFGEKTQPDGSVLSGFGVEVPSTDEMRFVVYRGRDGRYRLIDDFVESAKRNIVSVAEESGQLVYSAMDGNRVTARPIVSK